MFTYKERLPAALVAAALTLFAGVLVAGCTPTTGARTIQNSCTDAEYGATLAVYTVRPASADQQGPFDGVSIMVGVRVEGNADFLGVTLLEDVYNINESNVHEGVGNRGWWTGRSNEPFEMAGITAFGGLIVCYPRNEPMRLRVTATYTITEGDESAVKMDTYDVLECSIDDDIVKRAPEIISTRQLELLDLVKDRDAEGQRRITATCDFLYVPDAWVGDVPAEFPAATG